MVDRHDADEKLRTAIADHADAYGLNEGADMLTDFLVIATWMPQDYDDDKRHAYTVHLPDGYLANHAALGLVEVAKLHLLGADEDD